MTRRLRGDSSAANRREQDGGSERGEQTERDGGRESERESGGSMDATPRGATLSRILRSISPLRSNTMPAPTYYARHYRARHASPPFPLRLLSTALAPLAPLQRQGLPTARRLLSPTAGPAAPPRARGLTASRANFDPPIAPRRRLPRAGKLIHTHTRSRDFS